MKIFFRTFVLLLIIFTTIFTGIGFYVNGQIAKEREIVEIIRLKHNLDSLTDEKKNEETNIINILLLGVDALKSKNQYNSRTDTMIVFSLNKEKNKITLLSIPRDSRVKIRGRVGEDKINHAHAYGGVASSVGTVKSLLKVPIHHYVKVDYNALFKTVDDIGGVEVDVPIDMNYYDPNASPPLHINIKKGKQVLNGQKSMEFLRYRENYPNKDLGRIQAQQQFLDSFIKKVLSPASITKIPDYINTLHMYVETDLKIGDMLNLAMDAKTINPNEINKYTLKGEPKMINNISYYILDNSFIEKIRNIMI
ncbi:MAG: LCP family protein [Peptostreptococcaceae bacterium]|jgi:LCP family protein required for cell wall assembly|nr:LCP family protein [Peptostreptococcaceae bacterium]